jgi:hypothetical protein
MSTKASTAALEPLSPRLLLPERREPRHPAGGFFWRQRGAKKQDGLEGNIADTVPRGMPCTASEIVARAWLTMKLIRIVGILERAGFAVEIVNEMAGTDRV